MARSSKTLEHLGVFLDDAESHDFISLDPFFHNKAFQNSIEQYARTNAINICKLENVNNELQTLRANRNQVPIVYPISVTKAITLKSIPKQSLTDEQMTELITTLRTNYFDSILSKKTELFNKLRVEVLKHSEPANEICAPLNLHGYSFYLHEIRKNFITSFPDRDYNQPVNYCMYSNWPWKHTVEALEGRKLPCKNIVVNNQLKLTCNTQAIPPRALGRLFFTERSSQTLTLLINIRTSQLLHTFRTKSDKDKAKKDEKKAKFLEAQANNNQPANINQSAYDKLLKEFNKLKGKISNLEKQGNGKGRQQKKKPGGQNQQKGKKPKGKEKGKAKRN
jgi:hypothetical protein